MSDSESEHEEVVQDLSNPDVTTKYTTAGEIVNAALQVVVDACKDGADIAELCKLGDKTIEERLSKVYNKKVKGKAIDKGVAFPTCISVNEICGHYCPLPYESRKLSDGDLVKIDLGCQIDGYPAVAAHTIVVGTSEITGRKADVLRAAWTTAEAALRTVVAGNKNSSVTEVIGKCCEEFKCNPLQGVLSHQLKCHVINGNQVIISKETPEEKVEEFEFGVNEVYGVDIIVSTGEGKARETEIRTTVYKRAVEQSYSLKTQLARQFLSEVNKKYPTMPFTIRAIEDEKAVRMGVSECMRHDLLEPFQVLTEKPGELVAQFKMTVLLLPGGTKKITGLPFTQCPIVKSDYQIENEDIKKLLSTSANPKKAKKKALQELKNTN